MDKICGCGKTFYVKPYLVERKKHCSKACFYKYRSPRPFGLKYVITEPNKGWFPKGHKLRLGKKMSQATLEKLSAIRKGRHHSISTEFKKGQTSGEKNVRWKGGITPENMRIRQSQEYKEWRTAVFIRDDYTCQMCWVRGVTIHADHIKPFAQYPELRLELSNGRTLCVSCHQTTESYLRKPKKYV